MSNWYMFKGILLVVSLSQINNSLTISASLRDDKASNIQFQLELKSAELKI